MSYILSALKKVERARGTGAAPGLLSVQIEETPGPGRRLRTVAATVAVIAVVAAAAWQLRDRVAATATAPITAGTQPSQPQAPAVGRTPADTPATAGVQSAQPPAAEAALMQTRQPHPVTPADGTAPQAAYPPVDFDALSPQMRARIPPFSISGFLYSAARPHANKVIINGVALRAGQYVNDELMLKEINSDNIVMDFRGSLFRVGSDRLSGG